MLVPVFAMALLTARSIPGRDTVFAHSDAHWKVGETSASVGHPLVARGEIARPLAESGNGAGSGAHSARLTNAYFDAGKNFPALKNSLTVYLRARDPRGIWTYGLFNKRGSHEAATFNLFSVDLAGTPGPDIGFELHTDAGFVMVSFPISSIDPVAWHDFVGEYDGKSIALYCDGKIMAKRAWHGSLTQNEEPVLLGAETDHGSVIRPFTGEMEEAALWSRALDANELSSVMRKEQIMSDVHYTEPYASPIHFRPAFGRLADTIPFFWRGEYHVFYLRAIDKVPWEHIVSRDLVHWKELPTALVSDGAPDSADGLHMFTGSVIEKDGTFHIFYTGWNPANPAGTEFVMHATSPDLIHWTKHPEDILAPDGTHYSNQHNRDFRDPYLFWNAVEKQYMMFFCSGAHTGLAVSPDLKQWTQEPPVEADYSGIGTPECPDTFQIGDLHYLIVSPTGTSSTVARYSPEVRGPFIDPPSRAIDTPILYAAKRMFDGKRHILTGWLRDLEGDTDGGGFMWGGTQSVPREITAGPGGQLLFRPVGEAKAVFQHTALDLHASPAILDPEGKWKMEGATLVGAPGAAEAHCTLDVPTNYFLQCRVELDPKAVLSIGFREQSADSGYHLIIRPQAQEAEIGGAKFRFPRHIFLDPGRPISIEAFVQGDIIECFINDSFAFSCRAYNSRTGRLALKVSGGKARVQDLSVKIPRP